jgi:predicted RNA-binding protein YlxR (DUF448 family)
MARHAEPERTCVGCREKGPKDELLRVVPDARHGAIVDPSGSARGRGAYVHRETECAETALRTRAFARALRVVLGAEEAARLRNEIGRQSA